MAAQKNTHKDQGKAADELRETNEKLVKQLADHRLLEDVLRKIHRCSGQFWIDCL